MADAFSIAASAALLDRSKRSLAMGVASGMRKAGAPAPLFFERGEGAWYFDADGHRLLDYTLAWGPHSLIHDGHLHVIVSRRKEAIEVLRVALSDLADPGAP